MLGRKEEAGEQIHHTRLGSERPVIESGDALLRFLASLDCVRTLPAAQMSMPMVESLCPIYTTYLRDYSFSHSSLLAMIDPPNASRPKSADAVRGKTVEVPNTNLPGKASPQDTIWDNHKPPGSMQRQEMTYWDNP
ncbi:hypothetical protein AA0119_g11512 [Alternaria tenuissima]|uniref:Uncharacterized protein n=2 Tax=Alternaria alternata complex TaxID=187734 RepID=A0A4Q4MZP3_ALTAL|nr:hypothetical protein AA0117_g12277 [Alternaria alternata]RYN89259.1 hypothetical protein AA0119_g11512 [Alternaria tenuissima]RYO04908.1 hypothetical protein AA0121_g12605 [Alternaria tenuissima]RYO48020.1 hypothetical protein AA0116_g12797 [Alternaria tenuissima]